ncbi:MAG: carbohydrate-binding protein [Tannerella sp.]|jgi:hypothetical protein|nr:carbohydrate-binding protein [Tannerella sp.]
MQFTILKNKNLSSRMKFIFLPLSYFFLMALLSGCKENEFPVSPLPETFEMIPPSDVSLLTASPGDAKVSLKWGPPPETDIVAIHVKNLNNNQEKKLDGSAGDVEFTALTNFETQNFVVKTENSKGLLSYGAKIASIPFSTDAVKPATVTDLMGFKLNETSALATWTNPADADLAQIVVTLGNESVTVGRESTYSIINGNVSLGLKVTAVDFSGNRSEIVETAVDKDMVKISGSDDGVDETVEMALDPSVSIIDQYRISYGDVQDVIPITQSSYSIPLSALRLIWLNPVKVGLISGGQLVTEYNYAAHNDIPGTIRAAFYDKSEGSINIEGGDNKTNIGSLSDGTTTWYNVNIKETGLYSVIAYEARPNPSARYEVYLDDVLRGTGEVGGTGGWSNFEPFPGPTDLEFEAGLHVIKIVFLNGGANYEKFLFTKN